MDTSPLPEPDRSEMTTDSEPAPPPLILRTTDPEQTRRIGGVIGRMARPGDVYLLSGPLGAGKTCLTQGLARGLGVDGYVRSPTFVLMTRHQGRLTLHHIDLYRIGGLAEAWDLGLDEQLFGGGVCVIEWAERAEELLPAEALWLELRYGDAGGDHREIAIESESARYDELLRELAALPLPPIDVDAGAAPGE